MNKPDRWTIIKLPEERGYKVLVEWKGGYLYGDSWKLNSGITKVEELDSYYIFHGYSTSVYKCHKAMYGVTSGVTLGVLQQLLDNGCEQVKESDLDKIFTQINEK